ncbi:hypothetical protein HDU86_002178 [Geranomyces michiganensis]|nr:hypothetical protein HDU86_002178 [Geranomyces michiganensis]
MQQPQHSPPYLQWGEEHYNAAAAPTIVPPHHYTAVPDVCKAAECVEADCMGFTRPAQQPDWNSNRLLQQDTTPRWSSHGYEPYAEPSPTPIREPEYFLGTVPPEFGRWEPEPCPWTSSLPRLTHTPTSTVDVDDEYFYHLEHLLIPYECDSPLSAYTLPPISVSSSHCNSAIEERFSNSRASGWTGYEDTRPWWESNSPATSLHSSTHSTLAEGKRSKSPNVTHNDQYELPGPSPPAPPPPRNVRRPKTSRQASPRLHVCSAGCGKVFARADGLRRHVLKNDGRGVCKQIPRPDTEKGAKVALHIKVEFPDNYSQSPRSEVMK